MGICSNKLQGNIFTKEFIQQQQIIGRGTFGAVIKVRHKITNQYYALKKISKIQTILDNAIEQVLQQRQYMSQLDTIFIPKLIYSYIQQDWLCLLMQYVQGVTLRQCLMQDYKFAQREGIIIAASLIMMLQHMHSKKILHRDLKPQNIIITQQGLRVVDLGIAKKLVKKQNAGETSGTLAYLAPQTLFRQNYDITSDYYSLGVILHQIIFNKVPVYRQNQKELMDVFVKQNYQISKISSWSVQAIDFVNRLLRVRPFNRLGYKGAQQLKEHDWFKKYGRWQQFDKQNLKLKIEGVIKNEVRQELDNRFQKYTLDERQSAYLQNNNLFKNFQYLNEKINNQLINQINSKK